MVSTLWTACAAGDLEALSQLLNQASQVDLEARDHNGNTPLIEAARNGQVEVVRLLLDKGADPTNASSQGLPEQYTSDPVIHELISSARNKMASQGPPPESGYLQDSTIDVNRAYYPPPPGPYYYPGMPMPPPMLPDGSVPFYPPPPPHAQMPDMNGGLPNLPPPEIARMIPCRYYPACRYGPSCMFAHPPPPQGPYLSGPLPPPAQYSAPYESMASPPYPPTYYPVPSPSFQPAPSGVPVNPLSPTLSSSVSPTGPPHPGMGPPRSGPELVSPVQAPYNPAGAPPPMPYGVPGPSPYGPNGPVSIPGPHPGPGPQSPLMYQPTSPVVSTAAPYGVPQGYGGQPYPPHAVMPNGTQPDPMTSPKSPSANPPPEYYGPTHRESFSHHKRGNGRRPSFSIGRKPPCLFFPSGRCKNGNDCRFPHVLPDGSVPHNPSHFVARGGHRARPSFHNNNGINGLEDKFANLSTQENEQPPPDVQPAVNGTNGGGASNGSSRSQSTEPGSRGRGAQGYKSNPLTNGHRTDKKPVAAQKPQRLPSADEFPVLAGSATPPLRSPSSVSVINGWSGPTAAQVLQAPAPPRKESQPGTRGASPENGRPGQAPKDNKSDSSGAGSPAQTGGAKLPVSFAAVAAPEAAKEVAVSA